MKEVIARAKEANIFGGGVMGEGRGPSSWV